LDLHTVQIQVMVDLDAPAACAAETKRECGCCSRLSCESNTVQDRVLASLQTQVETLLLKRVNSTLQTLVDETRNLAQGDES